MAKKSNIVKKSKGNINLLIIVFLVVSWVCALVTLTSDEEAKMQAALVKEAEQFLEDDLYIRAVDDYLLALEYNTENNLEIETKLLATYFEAGMMDDYYSLAQKRIEQDTASLDEYLAVANLYVDKQSYNKAFPIIQKGITVYDDKEMIDLRESIIYDNKRKSINLPEMVQTNSGKIYPAFDGKYWGYVNEGGGVVLDFIYDEALLFVEGYTVVKEDGKYILITSDGYHYAKDEVGLDKVTDISNAAIVGVKDGKYQIYSRTFKLMSEETYDDIRMSDKGVYVVKKNDKWAILSPNLEPITDYVFTDVALNSKGRVFDGDFAMVNDGSGYCMIDFNGNALHENRFKKAKGFEGGLVAVANEQDKWGLANGSGEMIVDYQYADALSMSSNLAAVKHAGKWGYINRYNTMIIEPNYESLYPFIGNTALAKTEMGNYEVLTLKYYEYIE